MKKILSKPVLTLLLAAAAMAALSACAGPKRSGAWEATQATAGGEKADYKPSETTAAAPQDAPQAHGSPGGLTSTTGNTQLPAGRKLIQTVNMDVETDAFDPLLQKLQAKIQELGGYVEQSNISGNRLSRHDNQPIPRHASIQARIPADKLDLFVTTVEDNGNVTNKSNSTKDVTLQYSDTESRKKSLEIEQDRIWALLEKADSLDSVIALEQRLSDIRYELESLKSQLLLYDNQVAYSSVSLNINEVTTFTPTQPETPGQRIQKGFMNNVKGLGGFLLNLLIGLVAYIPIWAPLLAILALVLYLIRRCHKKIGHGRKDKGEKGQ